MNLFSGLQLENRLLYITFSPVPDSCKLSCHMTLLYMGISSPILQFVFFVSLHQGLYMDFFFKGDVNRFNITNALNQNLYGEYKIGVLKIFFTGNSGTKRKIYFNLSTINAIISNIHNNNAAVTSKFNI